MRAGQAVEIVAALIAQRIEFRGVNEGAGEAGNILGAQRGYPRIGRVRPRRRVVQEIVIERGLIDQIAACEVPFGIRRSAVIENRANQQLQRQPRAADSSGRLGRRRHQRAARRVAAYAEAHAVDTILGGMSADMPDRRQGVVQRGGKWVFGS